MGLDAGSVSVKVVIMDDRANVHHTFYERHKGHPVNIAHTLLVKSLEFIGNGNHLLKKPNSGLNCSLSITGSTGKLIADKLGVNHVNELIAFSIATHRLLPLVKTIIEMGGEESKLILLNDSGIEDFSMNSVCAAGTGSFLDQQAERLRMTIEEFSEHATKSLTPPRIAGRCSVFAKSDMIHLQQIATPVEDIVAGLCFAVARNFKGSIVKGRTIPQEVSFQGGLAANAGMVKAFKEILNINNLIVPEHFAFMGAIGSVLKNIENKIINNFDLKRFETCTGSINFSNNGRSPLISAEDDFFERHVNKNSPLEIQFTPFRTLTKAYLGIDIGSISTNLAVIDAEGNLISKRYLMTAGRPIEAVMQGLREIGAEVRGKIEILGVGTTGSGRYMIADVVGADIVKNEITAQARAAIFIDKNVDTIFEIGGQDSKYISIDNGVIVDFEMNKSCAAGTGSFLEEQAEKISISIREEFANCAFSSKHPCNLGERCTVFMENSLMSNLQRGAQKNDLLAGLAYSIVENYINRVVSGKLIGKNIFFQGGTAFNKAVVAAFEQFIGQQLIVPPNHDVTGAIGMALIARDTINSNPLKYKSSFKGFELSNRSYSISSFSCNGCSNVCEINRVSIESEKGHLYYGGRCEKYDNKKKDRSNIEDLFMYREELLWNEYNTKSDKIHCPESSSRRIGIPYIFLFQEYLPFWTSLLHELEFDVVISPKTNRQIVNLGLETVLSETCYPVKVAHGHIKYLSENGMNTILLPSFVSTNKNIEGFDKGSSCPYTQTIPYLAKAAFRNLNILSPIIDFSRGDEFLLKELKNAFKQFPISSKKIKLAIKNAHDAQKRFYEKIQEKGKTILSSVKEKTIVIVGRAYNAFDNGVNLQIPQKLANINVLSVPMDFLPLDEIDITNRWPNMYWKNGKRILQAARFIKDHPLLYPIYIGNFNCGPDSFILEYFKNEIGDKPFLYIEIDEHSADAGAITRCEAFLDSIENSPMRLHSTPSVESDINKAHLVTQKRSISNKGTIYIPRISDHAYAIAAAFEYCGIKAEVLPDSDQKTIELGRKYVSGKQCYPCVITTGEMLKKIFSNDFKHEESMFFMPSGTGPCRFGQYNVFQKLVLQKIGLPDIPIFSPVQDTVFYSDLGIAGEDFSMKAWQGIISLALLTKCLHETRPYEKEKGIAEHLYYKYLHKTYDILKSGNSEIEKILKQMRHDFDSVPKYDVKKPLIGVIGEIFVRSNKFSNENLISKIEALGGEVWLAPSEEWIYYVNHIGLKHALLRRNTSAILHLFVKNFFQRKLDHKYASYFKGSLKTVHEPSTRETIKKAKPYIHDSFEGETVLSIGKSIDLIEQGVSGIVSAMPFGCMPGTIVTALMRAIHRDFNIPCLSIPYDGTESLTTEIQLEAFMDQAKEYRK